MLEHDPNGIDWDDICENYIRETDWPMPDTAPTTPPDDEDKTVPDE